MKIENLTFNLDDDPEVIVPEDTQEPVVEESDSPQDPPEENTEDAIEDDLEPLARATYEKYVELGIIEPVENFDGKFESIDSLMEDVPVKLLNQAISELPQQSHAVLQFITAGGSSITKEDIIKFVDAWREETRTSFEVEDEAREYLAVKLKEQGLKERAITAQLDDLDDEGELLNEANRRLSEENTKTQKMIDAKKAERDNEKKLERQWFSAINEELKALNYSKTKSDNIQRTLSKANDILSSIYENPKAVIQLMDLLTKYNGKEFDLSDIEKQGASKTTSKIQQALQSNSGKSAGVRTTSTEQSDYITNPDRFVFGED